MDDPKVGTEIKVHLPGERPWAECVAVHSDGTWEGKILNELFAEMSEDKRQQVWAGEPLPRLHDFHRGDVVRFTRRSDDIWVPAEQRSGTS